MLGLSRETGWRPGRDLPFLALVAAAAVGTVPAVSQRSFDVSVGSTEASLVPSDVAFLVLGLFVAARLLGRARLPGPARSVTIAGAAFAAWLLASSFVNGAEAIVGALRLLEYGVLALGVVLFVQRRSQLAVLVAAVVVVAIVAGVDAGGDFIERGGGRQGAFLGPHDYAALATMALVVALAALYVEAPRRLAVAAGVAGVLGVVLGASFANLLGVVLAAAAVVVLAAARGAATPRRLGATALVLLVTATGVFGLRYGDLGLGEQVDDGGVPAGSFKVRAIHTYIGGKVFLENPVVGTGWYGELPPDEYEQFVDDARRRFPDVPDHYIPAPPANYVPQQAYDQVLFELGLVGAALFLLFGVLATRTVLDVGRRWPRGGRDEWLAFVPAGWLGSLAGALAGEALFGGGPIAAFFWLTVGIAAVAPSLVPPPAAPRSASRPREPAAVA